jgi:hypothetical protein
LLISEASIRIAAPAGTVTPDNTTVELVPEVPAVPIFVTLIVTARHLMAVRAPRVIGGLLRLELFLERNAWSVSATWTYEIHAHAAEPAHVFGFLTGLHDHDAIAMRARESVGLAHAVAVSDDGIAARIAHGRYSLKDALAATVPE